MVVSRDVTVGGQRPVLDPDLLAGGNVPLAAVEVLADPVGDAGLDVSVHDSPPSPDSTLARRPVPRPAFRQARHGCSTCGVPQLRRRPRIGQCSSAPHPRSGRARPGCAGLRVHPEVYGGYTGGPARCLPAAVFVLP